MPPERERKTAVERQREEREAKFIAETGALLYVEPPNYLGVDDTLKSAAERLRSWGALAAELKRAGWQSKQRECNAAAELVDALAVIVEQYAPPADAPTVHEQTRFSGPFNGADTDVTGRPRPAGVAELEQRLTDAFGPELAATRASVEREIDGHPGERDDAALFVACNVVTGVRDDENCTLPHGHGGDHSPAAPPLVCTMGPVCPVHPGIEVIHPTNAPTDAVVGPEGGTDPLPRDDAPTGMDPSALDRIAALPDTSGTITGELEIANGIPVLHNSEVTVQPTLPPLADPVAAPAARARLTYPELYQRRQQHGPADHRSVSQITTAADCGVKLALYREPETAPAWWNVAGTALHACVERREREIIDGFSGDGNPWLPAFYEEIERQRTATGVPVDRWRAARGGSEGYDWWRVQGEEFLKLYFEWSAARHAAGWSILTINAGGIDTLPVIEWPFSLDVGGVRVDGVVDQAWIRASDDGGPALVEIIDLKFGSSRPDDLFQIGVYAHALARTGSDGGAGPHPIGGAYYLGRKGVLHAQVPNVLDVVPWADVLHRTMMAESMDRAGIYMPRRSSFCNACGVRDLCPAGAS